MSRGTENAFPHFNEHGEVIHQCAAGLSIREYFAGLAMQGMMANADGINRVWKSAKALNPNDLQGAAVLAVEQHLAERAVSAADALLAELERTSKT